MKEKNQINFQTAFDTSKSLSLGKIDNSSPELLEIGRRVHESIKDIPIKIATESVKEAEKLISTGDHAEAVKSLMENSFFLPRLKDWHIIEIINSIDSSGLDKELRKQHLMLGVAYASFIGANEITVEYIELLENEFQDSLDEELVNGFILERARLALDEGRRSSAVLSYKLLSEKSTAKPREVAISFQGLAHLSSVDNDKAYFHRLSADKFLEAGLKKDAIGNLLELSKLQAKEQPNLALETLEKSLTLVSSEELFDRHGKAQLLQLKAKYLHQLGKVSEALEAAEEAIELEKEVLGAEVSLHSSYKLAEHFSSALQYEDKSVRFNESAEKTASLIKDNLFTLQQKVARTCFNRDELDGEILREVLDSGDPSLIGTVLLKQSLNQELSTEQSVSLLEDALKQLKIKDSNNVIDLVYFHFGLIYQKQGLKGDAESYYLKSLDCNPYNQSSANNLAFIYMEDESWEKAEHFFFKRIQLLGELPNHCFLYAKSLHRQHRYREALEYFRKVKSDMECVPELIEDCISNLATSTVITGLRPECVKHITSEDILHALQQFSESVSANSRMYFWKYDKVKKLYKWSSKPEETSKQLLIQSLSAKFGKDNVTIIQESRAGAGFIDLLLLFTGGLKVVIELKMCGAGYTSSYAISGKDQIIHYQDNTGAYLGYLVVFDARKNDFSKGLKKLQVVGNKTIYSIAVDVRTNVK
ncbi:hypothetical protein BZG25_12665 [Salinivibrio sp. ML198]|uniref:tetratricopeptide repeat protein n=1 Tax=Salinivibrio sp. ML198 TaxID=1909458 RepID=UPI0009897876|nr:tetratricopeptide repeat protein [Salinivibrio sp. ML198]OOE78351.1 hypothetical protein BZG25_12665 [Salinivibrio sp. ML198]